jgi:hypothetical protein
VVPIDPRRIERAFIRDFATNASSEEAAKTSSSHDPADVPWYHTIELPDGSVTPGHYDHRVLVPH